MATKKLQAARAKTRKVVKKAVRSGAISKRAAGVIKTGAREITQDNKKISTTRFIRSATKDIASKAKDKGYQSALVKSARKTTTKAEAKGVKKVLKRQGK